jgi:hypothetical protein
VSNQSDEEFRKTISDIARLYCLLEPKLPHLPQSLDAAPVLRLLDDQLSQRHAQGRLLLPKLSSFSSIAVFSDYGGEHKGSEYRTYSFLVTGDGATGPYSEEIRKIRDSYGIPHFKEIAYKDLGYGPVNRSLRALLAAAETLPGLLFTLVVHKNVDSLFGKNLREVSQWLLNSGSIELPPAVAEKSLRVVYFAVYLSSLLGRNGQGLFWFSDQDDIVADKIRTDNLLRIWSAAIGNYSQTDFPKGGLLVQSPKAKRPQEASRSIDVESLLSVPDLFAGVLVPVITQWKKGEPKIVKSGAGQIVEMLCHQGIFLKKLVFLIEPHPGGMSGSLLDFTDNSKNAENKMVILL